jgi:large repetitive protein
MMHRFTRLRFLFLIHLCIFALLFWTVKTLQSAPASATFNVNDLNDLIDDNPGNGICHAASGTCTLRAAVMEANYTKTAVINLPAGVYQLTIPSTGDNDGSGALKVRTGTTILGAGATGTIVDGNGAAISDRVFDIYTLVTQTASISGITIRNGKEAGYYGGGIHVLGPLTLDNCIVTNNMADLGAGGVWLDGSNAVLTMTNCTVGNNTSGGRAGGVDNELGTLTINNSTIISNHAASNGGGGLFANGNPAQTVVNGGSIVGNTSGDDGGGVYVVAYSPATLNGVLIVGNTAITKGGGIFNGGNLLMTNNTRVQNNTAYNGGGLYVTADVGSATLNNSSILSNTANNHGGGIYKDHGMIPLQLNAMAINANQATINNGGGIYVYDSNTPVRVNQSTVDNNTAGGLGAGVFVRAGSTVIVNNSTISNNTNNAQTDDGGGFYNSGTLTLTNSTVSGNGAVGYGGGIYNNTGASVGLFNVTIAYNTSGLDYGFGGSSVPGGGIENNGGTVTLRNTIVATNTLETPIDLVPNDCDGTLSSQGYNLIQTTGGGCVFDPTNNITGVDPNLGPLAFNGGGTQTNALLAGSPAIDKGNPGGCRDGNNVVLTIDQRGSRRPYPSVGRCDIGAFEYGWWLYLPLIKR